MHRFLSADNLPARFSSFDLGIEDLDCPAQRPFLSRRSGGNRSLAKPRTIFREGHNLICQSFKVPDLMEKNGAVVFVSIQGGDDSIRGQDRTTRSHGFENNGTVAFKVAGNYKYVRSLNFSERILSLKPSQESHLIVAAGCANQLLKRISFGSVTSNA